MATSINISVKYQAISGRLSDNFGFKIFSDGTVLNAENTCYVIAISRSHIMVRTLLVFAITCNMHIRSSTFVFRQHKCHARDY